MRTIDLKPETYLTVEFALITNVCMHLLVVLWVLGHLSCPGHL